MTLTRNLPLEQAGSTTGAGDWTDVALTDPIPFNDTTLIGLVFNVQPVLPFSSSGGLALDPPLWIGGGSFTLTLVIAIGGVVEVYLRQDPAFTAFSDTNPSLLTTGTNILLATDQLNPVAATTFSFTTAMDQSIRQYQAGRSTWNGRIPLIVRALPGANSSLRCSSLFSAVDFEPFFAGMIGGPYGGRNRFVRDGRYGMPALSTALVQDGDQPSLYVRDFDQDPEDPEAEYRPKPGEGSVDDSIPDL